MTLDTLTLSDLMFKYLWNLTITWSPCTLSITTLNTKYICVHCCCRVTESYPTLCDPMDCSTPSFPLLHYLPEFAQIHIHCADGDIPPHSVVSFSPCPQSFPSSRSFPMNWLFASGGQSIGASASASVLPMNSQDWFHLELTNLTSSLSEGSQSLIQHHNSKAAILQCSAFFMVQLTSVHD